MSVPPAMMSGSAGPGAMGPGGGPGGSPGGPAPEEILKLLATLQQSPPPSGDDQMMNNASIMVNGVYARIAQRSAKAARLLMEANSKIQQAREALQHEAQSA